MSDVPSPEISPPGPDVAPEPLAPEPAALPGPEVDPASTPAEAPDGAPVPDDGRPYDLQA
jgi:hypothetical protein